MRTHRHPQRHQDFNIERFKTRLTGKCCVVFICFTELITRLIALLLQDELNSRAKVSFVLAFPFPVMIIAIIGFEYLLFKKIGPKVMKYSKLIDIILLVIFTIGWILLVGLQFAGGPSLNIVTMIIFIDFAWKTLFLLFLVQGWKLIIIPPTIVMSLTIGFGIYYYPGWTVYIVLFGFPEMIYIILMLYFLDKFKWKEVFLNAQQERWMQINEFVLNNIPENIVILDLEGEVNFVSNYCRSFMQTSHLSQNTQDLFLNITELYQQQQSETEEPSSPSNTSSRQGERMTTLHGMIEVTHPNPLLDTERINNLQDLIDNFRACIKGGTYLKERQFLIFNGKLKTEDLHTKSIEIKISYIQQYGREHIILIIRDTTQRDLLVTLEDKNKYKDQLLASVSHELRAPLNGNINLVESALQDKNISEDVKERLLIPALRSSQFLLHLINDILDMSQIKAQKLRLIFKSEKLQKTLRDTLQLVELQAKKKGIDICLNMDPAILGITFSTDHIRLSQIILNLLNNSIKFTQKGSVLLSALPTENPDSVKISVKDSGIGMTKEDIKKLFSDYTHIEFAGRADINPTGVGLGLNIAYNLAKLLGPKDKNGITVESVSNVGSTFSFIIENKEEQLDPLDLAIKKDLSDKSQKGIPEEFEPKVTSRLLPSFSVNPMTCARISSETDSLTPKTTCLCPKILLVDDNPFNTMAFETVLNSLNLKCDSAFDGRTAIDKILDRQKTLCGSDCQPYRWVFMDQEMPGMTGSETVEEIKRLQAQGLIPSMKIIGCTAHASIKEVEKFMESGLNSCIQKPITTHVLQKILQDQDLEKFY